MKKHYKRAHQLWSMPRGYSLTEGRSFWVAVVLIIFLSFYLLYAQPTGFVGRTAVTSASTPAAELIIQSNISPVIASADVVEYPSFSVSGLQSGESIKKARFQIDGQSSKIALSGAIIAGKRAEILFHSPFAPFDTTKRIEEGPHSIDISLETSLGRKVNGKFHYLIDQTPPSIMKVSQSENKIVVRITDAQSGVDPYLPVYLIDKQKNTIVRDDDISSSCTGPMSTKECIIVLPENLGSEIIPVVFPYDTALRGNSGEYGGNSSPTPFPLTGDLSGDELLAEMEEVHSNESDGRFPISFSGLSASTTTCSRAPETIEMVVIVGGSSNFLSPKSVYQANQQANDLEHALSDVSELISAKYPAMSSYSKPITTQINVTLFAPTNMVGYFCNSQGTPIVDFPLLPGEEPQLCDNQKYMGGSTITNNYNLKFYKMVPSSGTTTQNGWGLIFPLDSYYSTTGNTEFYFDFKQGSILGNEDGYIQPLNYDSMTKLIDYFHKKLNIGSDPKKILVVNFPTIELAYPSAVGLAFIDKSTFVVDRYRKNIGTEEHELGHLLGLDDHYNNPKADKENIMNSGYFKKKFDGIQLERMTAIMCSENLLPSKTGEVGEIENGLSHLFGHSCNNSLIDTSPAVDGFPREECGKLFSGKIKMQDFMSEKDIRQICPIDQQPKPLAASWEDIPLLEAQGKPVRYCTIIDSERCRCLTAAEGGQQSDYVVQQAPITSYFYCDLSGKCWPTDNFTEPWDTPTPSSPPAEGTAVTPEPVTPVQEKPKPCGVVTPAPPADPNAPPFSTPPAPVCGGACEKSSDTCTTSMNVETNQWECGCIELNYVSPNETLIVEEIASPREGPSSESDSSGDGVAIEAIDS